MAKSGENQKSCLITRWRPQTSAKWDLHSTDILRNSRDQNWWNIQFLVNGIVRVCDLYSKGILMKILESIQNAGFYQSYVLMQDNFWYSVFWAYLEKFIQVFLFGNSIWNAPWPAKPQHNILFFLSFGFIHISDCTMNCSIMQKTEKPFSLIGCAQ